MLNINNIINALALFHLLMAFSTTLVEILQMAMEFQLFKYSDQLDGIPVRILEKFMKKSAQICKIPAKVNVKNTLDKYQ
jgi:hypothetical protein